jgi:hypothetical protein
MVSKRKIRANRQNSAHSTGPSTADGKARARRNSYRHGLAVSVLNDPAISAEVEELARAIAGKQGAAYQLAQARLVAEAEFDLLRVRATRVKTIDREAAQNLSLAAEARDVSDTRLRSTRIPISATHSEFEVVQRALLRALPQLEILERYERRAFSRRRRAIRQMYDSSI